MTALGLNSPPAAARAGEAARRLVEKSGWVFLYLQYARQRFEAEGAGATFSAEDMDALPEGLTELYDDEFERMWTAAELATPDSPADAAKRAAAFRRAFDVGDAFRRFGLIRDT